MVAPVLAGAAQAGATVARVAAQTVQVAAKATVTAGRAAAQATAKTASSVGQAGARTASSVGQATARSASSVGQTAGRSASSLPKAMPSAPSKGIFAQAERLRSARPQVSMSKGRPEPQPQRLQIVRSKGPQDRGASPTDELMRQMAEAMKGKDERGR